MDKKRLVLLSIFLFITLLLGFLLYVVFFKRRVLAPPAPLPPTTTSTRGKLPTTGERALTPPARPETTLPEISERPTTPQRPEQEKIAVETIVEGSVTGAAANPQGGVNFYNRQDGRFYKVNDNGESELLSDQVFFNVDHVTWSPKETKSIIEYPDGSNIYYDFASKKQVTLPKHWEEFSFDNTGSAITAKSITLAPENRWLISANPEGNNIKLIEQMGENADKVQVDWSPNRQIIATTRTGEGLGGDREQVLFVGQNDENFRGMVVEGRGFKSSWSPEGEKMLYSVYSSRSDFKPELWVVRAEPDTIGDERRLLGINTWPEKCAFADERFLYCGVPKELKTGAGIAPTLADTTHDAIFRIDTQTGSKTEIPLENSGNTVEKMFLGEDGKTIYFTDKQRPGIFKIPL